METRTKKPGRGRPELPDNEKKRARSLSLNDDQHKELMRQTKKFGFGKRSSDYIIHKLSLPTV